MDVSEYLPMFLAEAREHLQELNLAVVRIEETPDDRETVDEIFRIAHSMKGMSATMGFAAMAALTHQMEDVFELLRQRSGGLGREVVDVLLECLDAIEGNVGAIEADGSERLDPAPLVERLKGLVGQRAAAPAPVEERAVAVQVRLAEDCGMPGVRAYMVLAALAGTGELAESVPMPDDVEAFDGRVVTATLVTAADPAAVRAAAAGVADVADVLVGAVAEPRPEPAPEPAAAPGGARPAAHGRKAQATVRIDAERLDQLMHFMGELVVHRTQVEGLVAQADVPGLPQAMQDLTRSSQALQAMVMQVRMMPVESVFMRFPRLVRDLSSKLGKQVELVLTGKETELDRTVIEALGDPIVHLVRNSLDHGLETPEQRVAAGKPATGRLELGARHAGGNVVITVRDDGRGIDPARVAAKAAERGLIPHAAIGSVDTAQAVELLFSPGFSTADTISDVSGRGVGMDSVRTTIRELGGEVELTSELGVGSSTQIRLPLTLAIMAALLVEADGAPFAIPLDRVERTLNLRDHPVRSVAGRRMLVLRDGALPLVDAAEAFGGAGGGDHANVVIVHGAGGRLALAVERLVGQRELVTKPLPPALGERSAVSGGAVMSDGSIALIVDCDAIFGATGRASGLAA